MDPQLLLFRRQYLQLVEPEFLAWPPKSVLTDQNDQSWIYKRLFDPERTPQLPCPQYQLKVLKLLLAKIEQSVDDSKEHVSVPLSSFHNFVSVASRSSLTKFLLTGL